MRAVFDINVLVDYLNGLEQARLELGRYRDRRISIVTWMEVLVGAHEGDEELTIRAFLDDFDTQALDLSIAEEAVRLRRAHGIRLPDAIIWATARVQQALLVTRNTKDFPSDDPAIRFPYSV